MSSRSLRLVLRRFCRGVGTQGVLAALAVVLVGCAPNGGGPSIDELRASFVGAGGICASWKPFEVPGASTAIQCDGGARLYTFSNYDDQSVFVKRELETNMDIRARTHIMLSNDYTLVIDRIEVIIRIMPKLHGMIQGRNGANP